MSDPRARVAEVHDLAPDAFAKEVHSFEFWFQAVEGYLSGTSFGHRPNAPDPPLEPAERERLVTVLCNYCVGETAALEGASGLVAIAPNRLAKVFLATQAVDEGRHLEVLLHRLADLGESIAAGTEPDEVARGRILAIVEYLKSIQRR